MQPPWDVEPALFADKFWIVAQSDYLDRWRAWFASLPEGEQRAYEQRHPEPAICDGSFYLLSREPRYDPAAMAAKHRDSDGNFAPPWLAFPGIGLGSIGWRMGPSEDYWHIFADWFAALTPDRKQAFKDKYPEPFEVENGLPWTGFYERKECNG